MGRKTCCEEARRSFDRSASGQDFSSAERTVSLEAFSEVWGDEMGSSLQNHWDQKKGLALVSPVALHSVRRRLQSHNFKQEEEK